MQTKEIRMRKHYKSLMNTYNALKDYYPEYTKGGSVWMVLARTWKMPIKDVKQIVLTSNQPTDRIMS